VIPEVLGQKNGFSLSVGGLIELQYLGMEVFVFFLNEFDEGKALAMFLEGNHDEVGASF